MTAAEKKRQLNILHQGTVAEIFYVDEFNCSACTKNGTPCKKLALYFSNELNPESNSHPHYCSLHLTQNSNKLLTKLIRQKLTLQSRQLVKQLSVVNQIKYQLDTHPYPAPEFGEGWFKRHPTSCDFVKDPEFHYQKQLTIAKNIQEEMIRNRRYFLTIQDVKSVLDKCYICQNDEDVTCIKLLCEHTICNDCLSNLMLKTGSNSCGLCRASIC